MTRLPGLDGLRAVACLMVFAVHFGQATKLQGHWGPFDVARLLENGNTGVALFFALSGFLLSGPYWRAMLSMRPLPPAGGFFIRRAARIVPAYYACLTGLIVVNRLWHEDDWPAAAVQHYLFVFNFFDASIFRINPPFWTVAVEAQFYLLLPICFVLVSRVSVRRAALIMTLLAVACYLASATWLESLGVPVDPASGSPRGVRLPPVAEYSLLTHLPHFLLGVLTAWLFASAHAWPSRAQMRFRAVADAALWSGVLVLLVILGTPLDDWLRVPHGRYNLPFVPLLLCLVILATPFAATGRVVLDTMPARAIGAVSYGVYLYHLPVQHLTARIMLRQSLDPAVHWLSFGGFSLALTLAVAATSYIILERPVMNAVRRFSALQPTAHNSK